MSNGVVDNEQKSLMLSAGEVVQLLVGGTHCHGATADSYVAHIAIAAFAG